MRPSTRLAQSVQKITLDTHRQIRAREDSVKHYKMGETEQQYQCDISGAFNTLPAETLITVKFQVIFSWDVGTARDSQLGEPLFRGGLTLTSAPSYTIPYVYVSSWIQNDLLDYTGAKVMVGVHNPDVGGSVALGTPFTGRLHLSFQGYGAPIDPANDLDS